MLYQCSLAVFYVEQVALNRHVRRHFRLPCLCALRGKMSSESRGVGEPTHLVSETDVYFRKRLHTQGPRKSTIHASAATIQGAESQGAEETATEIEITTKKTRATILDNAMIAGQFRDKRWSDCGGLEAG